MEDIDKAIDMFQKRIYHISRPFRESLEAIERLVKEKGKSLDGSTIAGLLEARNSLYEQMKEETKMLSERLNILYHARSIVVDFLY